MEKKHAILNWSGGKDSSYCLYQVLRQGEFEVNGLATTLNSENQRISMHGVHRNLLQAQGESLGLPIVEILLPENTSMKEYDKIMKSFNEKLLKDGTRYSIFGDIFLEDLKLYRENQLKDSGIDPVFPLWKMNTREMALQFIDSGFKAIIVCVNAEFLNKDFAGMTFDREFLNAIPESVDPCGENGEFHTFVFDGPIFNNRIHFEIGDIVFKTYPYTSQDSKKAEFYFCDLISAGTQ